MYAVMGATGQVGEVVARELLNTGAEVRALVRAPQRARSLREQGAELVVVDARRAWTLSAALAGTRGAFVLVPPCAQEWDPLGSAAEIVRSLARALRTARPPVVVALSSIGAHLACGSGLVAAEHLLEEALWDCAPSLTFVRSAWFLEEWAGAVWPARRHGVLPSTFAPLDRGVPQVSAVDVGRLCADALLAGVVGARVLEVKGPCDYSPCEVADGLSAVLGRSVEAQALSECLWEETFVERGDSRVGARLRMETLCAVNDGILTFEGGHSLVRGELSLTEVIGAADMVSTAGRAIGDRS
jgi:NAD(P)H dehydrogenase (quinone)